MALSPITRSRLPCLATPYCLRDRTGASDTIRRGLVSRVAKTPPISGVEILVDQARRPIHEELLSIVGISGAEFEGDASTPEGVKVQLAPGADPDVVAREIKRVLAGHGMRSQMTAPRVAPKQAPPPPEVRTVVNLADFDPALANREKASADPPARPATSDIGSPVALSEMDQSDADHLGDAETDDPAVAGAASPAGDSEIIEDGSVPILEDVAVKQTGGGIAISVSAGGRVAHRLAIASEKGIDVALLEAISELLAVAPVPALISVTRADHEGSSIVTVLVDDGEARRAGSAVSRGNRAWSVARAFWSALSGPA